MNVSITSATPTRKVTNNYGEEKRNKKHPHNFPDYFQYILNLPSSVNIK